MDNDVGALAPERAENNEEFFAQYIALLSVEICG